VEDELEPRGVAPRPHGTHLHPVCKRAVRHQSLTSIRQQSRKLSAFTSRLPAVFRPPSHRTRSADKKAFLSDKSAIRPHSTAASSRAPIGPTSSGLQTRYSSAVNFCQPFVRRLSSAASTNPPRKFSRPQQAKAHIRSANKLFVSSRPSAVSFCQPFVSRLISSTVSTPLAKKVLARPAGPPSSGLHTRFSPAVIRQPSSSASFREPAHPTRQGRSSFDLQQPGGASPVGRSTRHGEACQAPGRACVTSALWPTVPQSRMQPEKQI